MLENENQFRDIQTDKGKLIAPAILQLKKILNIAAAGSNASI